MPVLIYGSETIGREEETIENRAVYIDNFGNFWEYNGNLKFPFVALMHGETILRFRSFAY